MIRLVIAEKPSVAKAIAKVIGSSKQEDGYITGGGFAVSWCFGHLAELAQPESYNESYAKWKYEDLPILPDAWQYSVSEDKRKQLETVSRLMNRDDVTEVINACDAGREGELIFRTVYTLSKCNKPIKRLWISSMEDSAVKEGFDNLKPGADYDNLYMAALARSKADWLVGINATRLFSVLYHRTLNVGRVVSPTLAILVQREAEISAFQSEPYYKAVLDFGKLKAESEKISDKNSADALAQFCKSEKAYVKAVERKEKSENPPLLYDLTTLQRDANRILGYTAQQTLDYLQSLYEKKLCTYPRTDSKFLTDDMTKTADDIVKISAETLNIEIPKQMNIKSVCNSKKVSDHHAVILTKSVKNTELAFVPAGEREILKLIAKRIVCAVSEPYSYIETVITLVCGDTEFTAKGRTVTNLGFKAYGKAEENSLPELSEGQTLENKDVSVSEGKTTPPKHYTEDTILSAMENVKDIPDEAERKGLGTPATRAGIIEKLVSVGFVERKKGKKTISLIPSGIGTSLITVLPEELQSPLLTAEWEEQLLQIEKGELAPDKFLADIETMVGGIITDYKVIDGAEVLFPSGRTVVGKCPRCGSDVTESKKGYFCEKNSCRFALWRDNRFLTGKKINLTSKMAEKLLKDGRAYVSGIYSEKTGKKYDAFIVLDDNGEKTTFNLDFGKER